MESVTIKMPRPLYFAVGIVVMAAVYWATSNSPLGMAARVVALMVITLPLDGDVQGQRWSWLAWTFGAAALAFLWQLLAPQVLSQRTIDAILATVVFTIAALAAGRRLLALRRQFGS